MGWSVITCMMFFTSSTLELMADDFRREGTDPLFIVRGAGGFFRGSCGLFGRDRTTRTCWSLRLYITLCKLAQKLTFLHCCLPYVQGFRELSASKSMYFPCILRCISVFLMLFTLLHAEIHSKYINNSVAKILYDRQVSTLQCKNVNFWASLHKAM